MALTKDSIAKLEIGDELKADILALFGNIETHQANLDAMRAKLPTDSQKVVESVDFDKFTAATKELEILKQELADKLAREGGEQGETFLAAFSAFFN